MRMTGSRSDGVGFISIIKNLQVQEYQVQTGEASILGKVECRIEQIILLGHFCESMNVQSTWEHPQIGIHLAQQKFVNDVNSRLCQLKSDSKQILSPRLDRSGRKSRKKLIRLWTRQLASR